MKKIISMSLSLMMTISVLAPCHSVIAQEVQLQNIVSTGNKIAELCADYDDYNTACDDAEIKDRLIVKASGNIDEYGAVDSVYGFGYAFLQYADKTSAEEAKVQYENLGYTVDYDSVAALCNTNSNDYPQYANWPEEWAYEETDAVSAIDYYKRKFQGTTVARRQTLRAEDFLAMPLNLPEIHKQKWFLQFMQQSDKSKFELQQAIEKVDNLIKSLIQQDNN